MDDEERARGVGPLGGPPEPVEFAGKTGIPRHKAGAAPIHPRVLRSSPVPGDFHIEGREVGFEHRLIFGVQIFGQKYLVASLIQLPCHEGGLGQGRGPVVMRCVDHRNAEEAGGHALILEYRLQCPLRNLGLIGSIGGEEFTPGSKGRDQGWNKMIVDSGPQEPGNLIGPPVFRGHRPDLPEHLLFGEGPGKLQFGKASPSGHVREQLFHAPFPYRLEHFLPVGFRVGNEGHGLFLPHQGSIGLGVQKSLQILYGVGLYFDHPAA